MIRPVTQRVGGSPHGECARASLATVLGLPLDAVPPLDPASCEAAGETQDSRERRWLRGLGLDVVRVPVADSADLDRAPCVTHLMTGVSPRGLGHRVVGWGGRMIHDPHSSRAGLVRVLSVEFLVLAEALDRKTASKRSRRHTEDGEW